jgi:hydroxymethylbilane synthase
LIERIAFAQNRYPLLCAMLSEWKFGGIKAMAQPILRLGSRGSPLAMAQTIMTRAALMALTGEGEERFPLTIIKTSGDTIQDRALSESGGKGLFTKEIDEAQLANAIDVSIHSGKDLPTRLPDGLMEAGYLPRADIRDAFIGHKVRRLADLPQGAKLGTASLRRGAQARRLRPDLEIALIRGNVDTRLRKVAEGEFDGTLLAMAGLTRLGLTAHVHEILEPDVFLPAVAQGAIGIVIRETDSHAAKLVRDIIDVSTSIAVSAERAFLRMLDGSCKTPIAGYARLLDGDLNLQGQVLSVDGRITFEGTETGNGLHAAQLGETLGMRIKEQLPPNFFAH